MTPFGRIALGALIGSLLTLAIHPSSRPFLGMSLFHLGRSETMSGHPLLQENIGVLPYPGDAMKAAIWMEVGANRINRRLEIKTADLRALIRVANAAGQSDPNNAFWPQMEAVFRRQAKDIEGTLECWHLASRRLTWNDYQSNRLLMVRTELEHEFGGEQAWQSARLFYSRTDASAAAIERLAGYLTGRSQANSVEDLEFRMATLRNGVLVRNSSRSLKIGLYGVNMIEFSSYNSRRMIETSPKKLLISRYELINKLRARRLDEEVQVARTAFESNEGWLAMTGRDEPQRQIWWLTMSAVNSAAIPSALLLSAVVTGVIWGIAALILKRPKLHGILRVPLAPLLGISTAMLVYSFTEFWPLSITIVLTIAFAAFSPATQKKSVPGSFGPMFVFVNGLLGFVFAALVAFFIGGLLSPTVETLPHLNIPAEYFGGGTLPLALGGIILCLVLIVATLFAFVERVDTPIVALSAYRTFGKFASLSFLLLCVVATPVAVALDNRIEPVVSMILQNEPNYYVLQ